MNEAGALEVKNHLFYLLEFLRISPGYALATEIRSKKMNKSQAKKRILDLYSKSPTKIATSDLINDFDKVFETFYIYGDISKLDFDSAK